LVALSWDARDSSKYQDLWVIPNCRRNFFFSERSIFLEAEFRGWGREALSAGMNGLNQLRPDGVFDMVRVCHCLHDSELLKSFSSRSSIELES